MGQDKPESETVPQHRLFFIHVCMVKIIETRNRAIQKLTWGINFFLFVHCISVRWYLFISGVQLFN